MTNAERQRRRYARLTAATRLPRIKKLFLDLLDADKRAFLDWLKRRGFI